MANIRDRAVDVATFCSLALFPLLPQGFTYVGLDWPWALDAFFLLAAALGLIVVVTTRPADLQRAPDPERLVRRGYATWVIAVIAATLIGVADRIPLDDVFLRIEGDGLLGRLATRMDQAADPFYPVRVGLTCLEGALAFWLLSALLRRTSRPSRRIRAALRGCLLGIALVSIIAIVQYITRANLLEYWVRANPDLTRSHATLDDPNSLASFLVLGIGLAIGVAWSGPRRWIGGRRAIFTAALACGALFTTVSRAGWAALGIAALVFAATASDLVIEDRPFGRVIRRAARVAAVLMIAVGLLWAVAFVTLPKRTTPLMPETPWAALVQTVDPRESLETILKHRHVLWQAGLQMASTNWTLGAGLGQFPRLVATDPRSNGPENAHNYFLQTLAEVGVVGLAALGLLLISIALAIGDPTRTRGGRRTRLAIGLSTGVLAFVLTWLTGHPLLNLSNQIWLASVLAVGLAALEPTRSIAPVQTPHRVRDRLRSWLLHPAWVPAVAAVTLMAAVPRAIAARDAYARESRAAGVYAWEPAPAGDFAPAELKFRWTRGHAAVKEPVRGPVLTLPLYLARPDISRQPIMLHVNVGGVPVHPATLTRNGWHKLTYDLVTILGEPRERLPRTVTLEFTVIPAVVPALVGPSDDRRELGVGLGVISW